MWPRVSKLIRKNQLSGPFWLEMMWRIKVTLLVLIYGRRNNRRGVLLLIQSALSYVFAVANGCKTIKPDVL